MRHMCSFAMQVKPMVFLEISLSCHQFCLIFFFCLHVVLLSRIELLLRLKDDLVLVFCIV